MSDTGDNNNGQAGLVNFLLWNLRIIAGDILQLLLPLTQAQCPYIRCLGLNDNDHAEKTNLALPETSI